MSLYKLIGSLYINSGILTGLAFHSMPREPLRSDPQAASARPVETHREFVGARGSKGQGRGEHGARFAAVSPA